MKEVDKGHLKIASFNALFESDPWLVVSSLLQATLSRDNYNPHFQNSRLKMELFKTSHLKCSIFKKEFLNADVSGHYINVHKSKHNFDFYCSEGSLSSSNSSKVHSKVHTAKVLYLFLIFMSFLCTF